VTEVMLFINQQLFSSIFRQKLSLKIHSHNEVLHSKSTNSLLIVPLLLCLFF